MRTCRDDARTFPDVGDVGIFQLLFQPGELARELLPHRPGHLEFEQEGAAGGVADNALELTEIAESCWREPHQYQLVFSLEAARKLDLSRALAQFPRDFLLRIELAPPPRQLVRA